MEFKLPELGEGIHEGELVKWHVKPGDQVRDDQILCEVMTDKATVEVPSPFHGTIQELHCKEGQTIKVGQLMISYEGGASAQAQAAAAHPAATPALHLAASAKPAPHAAPSETVGPAGGSLPPSSLGMAGPGVTRMPTAPAAAAMIPASGPVLAAPSTRRFAREMGVDISRIAGSGPHGRVTREDVERATGTGAVAAATPMYARGPAPAPAAPTVAPSRGLGLAPGRAPMEHREPMKGLRKKIAEKMRLSKDHAAHFTYVEEADATELVRLRNSAKEIGAQHGIKVTYLPFLMKAMIPALRKYPILNSSLDEQANEIVYKNYYNIALSVQTDDGLTAPVVKNVQDKSVLELAREIQDLVERARAKRLTMEELTGGTITITNAGSIGGLFATPVINYPEVAILGFNKIFRKPVVKVINGKEEIVISDWTYFSISLDHRVVDGAIGAEFMKVFIRYIENPNLLLLGEL